MIIGNGLIASLFMNEYKNDDNFIIFAAGVSNSLETNINEFRREENLLFKTLSENKNKHLIYFSSFIDSNSQKRMYTEHKINMETLIKDSKNYYTILKLPQVIGYGGNSHTLINFIVNKIKSNEEITVYKNTYKSLIDVDDIKRIVDILLKEWKDKNTYVEFPYIEKLQVYEIINLVAKHLNIDPIFKYVDSEAFDFPDLSLTGQIILTQLNITPKGYTEKAIKKYVK
jgi:nucleoside-diphosphate-sugar epimerase